MTRSPIQDGTSHEDARGPQTHARGHAQPAAPAGRGSMLALVLVGLLAQGGDQWFVVNLTDATGWCAERPVPEEEGHRVAKGGGWARFPIRAYKPLWCTPGMAMEMLEEHAAPRSPEQCAIWRAMNEASVRY